MGEEHIAKIGVHREVLDFCYRRVCNGEEEVDRRWMDQAATERR
jgi:hypothetical protein